MSDKFEEYTAEQARELLDKVAEERGTLVPLETGRAHAPGHTDACTCGDCIAMDEHVCACFNCKPLLLPEQKERLGTGHYGTRFGLGQDQMLCVYKEVDGGLQQILDVVEVEVDQGWAIRVSQPLHMCQRCMQNVCLYKDKGEFAVAFVHNGAESKS